ncbi:hypothetical protein [Ornithinimicrobium pratense]|nr:hypothetical protein [Ornithinimicrobium pratense]
MRFVPGRQDGVRVAMLTMNVDDDTILAAMRVGAIPSADSEA